MHAHALLTKPCNLISPGYLNVRSSSTFPRNRLTSNANKARRSPPSEPALPKSIFSSQQVPGASDVAARRPAARPPRNPVDSSRRCMLLNLRTAWPLDRQRGTPREVGERGGRHLSTLAAGEREKATLRASRAARTKASSRWDSRPPQLTLFIENRRRRCIGTSLPSQHASSPQSSERKEGRAARATTNRNWYSRRRKWTS